jgi:hypothetical protein
MAEKKTEEKVVVKKKSTPRKALPAKYRYEFNSWEEYNSYAGKKL